MLKIKEIHASINGTEILKGLNLEIKPGEIHAIMGPNGSGKSTLASVLTGKPEYEVTKGSVEFMGENLLEMEPEVRAKKGVFLSFQYPVEIPGVSMMTFLKTALNSKLNFEGKKLISSAEFLKLVREKQKMVEITSNLTNRAVNEGFSGGEKKKNEIFQMALLEPMLSILD